MDRTIVAEIISRRQIRRWRTPGSRRRRMISPYTTFDNSSATNAGVQRAAVPLPLSRTATARRRQGSPIKGNVEGVVGYARRNFMTPLPRFASWDAFNGHLEEQCRNRQGNVLRGHRESIGERFVRDREALKRPLPAPFDACDKQGTRVNSLSLVRYRTNDYSVPVAYGHQEVWIRGYVHEVGYRLRRRDHCPTPPFLRPGRYGLRSDPLGLPLTGAQDRCPGSRPRRLAGWELPDAFPTLRRLLEARMGKAGKRRIRHRSFGLWRPSIVEVHSRRGEGRPAPGCDAATTPSNTLCCAVSSDARPNSTWISIPTCLGPTWRPRPPPVI